MTRELEIIMNARANRIEDVEPAAALTTPYSKSDKGNG